MSQPGIDIDYFPTHVREWAERHLELLELVANHLVTSGSWPEVSVLTKRLAGAGTPTPLRNIFWGMPKPLGWIEHLTGELPFVGPAAEDFREAHLHEPPPDIPSAPPVLASLVGDCLHKSPGARPNPSNFRARLERAAEPPASTGLASLQSANSAEAQRPGRAAAETSQQMARQNNDNTCYPTRSDRIARSPTRCLRRSMRPRRAPMRRVIPTSGTGESRWGGRSLR